MLRKGYGFILIIAISCSCHQSGSRFGVIEPQSEMQPEGLEINSQPLEISRITADSAGVMARYEFLSDNCLCTADPELVLSESGKRDIRVNGKEVELVGGHFYIGGMVNTGNNIVEVRWEGVPGEVSLSGNFDVMASEDGGWYVTYARVKNSLSNEKISIKHQ